MALSVVMLMLLVVVMVGTVQGQAPPTGLSAVHTTSTTIRVYWSPPTSMPTGYEITYFAGAEDVTGTAVPVSGGSTNSREIYNLSATITYRVSIVSLNGTTRSNTTGPVMAARGPGLALKGAVFPNHSVLRRDPSVIGEDDDALYCVTDDVTCCGTPPSPSDGGSGNGQGHWIFPNQNIFPSGTAVPWFWYARWLTGAVLMNFRGTATTGTTGFHRCEVQDSTGTLHQFYICIYGYNTDTHQCVVRITDPLQFSLQTTPTVNPPVFTLTCVSTSGPATTVTWTRDGTAVPYDFDHVLSQTVADQYSLNYSNVLTVTGNEPGNYLCSVTNDRTALLATASLTVAAAETPSNITVNRVTPTATSITVSWSVPSTGAIPTGYIVHYLASGDKGSTIINSGATTTVTITVLSTELVYEITLQTLSDMLPSAKSMTITIGIVFEPIQFNLVSSLNAESPVFVLTCNSTSVFPVTYTWMRNGSALIANENHTITKQRAACCDWTVSTLKVMGRYNGNYKCTVDAHGFEHSQSREFIVKLWILLNPPTVISAIKDGASGIRVCWTPPLLHPTRGYKIYYRADGELSKKVEVVPSISAQDWRITSGIQNGVDYLITMVAVGDNNYESIAIGPVLAARSPGVVLLGKLLKNNSVISHSNIGTNDKAVYCVVNDARCCAGSAVARQRGNWYLPNGFQLNSTEKSDYSANHTKAAVLLSYHGDSSGVSGIFRCNILDQSNTLYSFFIGVYSENEGGPIVADTIGFSLLSAPNADPPQFNLTCTSTGGPAMTVTWTRNEVVINEDSSHLFSQQIVNTRVAEYNNKLTVTGRELGVYKCSVCNSRGQSTGILRLTAPPPTSLSAVHETATSIDVYWTPPVSDILTGYVIVVQSNGKGDIYVSVSEVRNKHYTITTGIDADVKYFISLQAEFHHLALASSGQVIAARGPGLALKGAMIPNHSVLKLDPSVIGEDDDALYCVTDDVTCCGIPPSSDNGGSGNGRGYWYYPNNIRLSSYSSNLQYASWLTGAVLMNFHETTTAGTTGLFHCDINDSTGTRHHFYTCLHDSTNVTQCYPHINGPIQFSAGSEFNTGVIEFSLTCISSNGPAQVVTWTRDGVAITGDTSQTVVDQLAISYHNTLTVSGRLPGSYQCNVANNIGSAMSQSFFVQGAYPPREVKAAQFGSTITVYWTPPTVGATPTGYVIYYQAHGEEVESVTLNDGSLTKHNIVGVKANKVYAITMLTISHMLPSQETTPFRNEVADIFATITSINGILLKWRSIAMSIDISTDSYCFTVYYTVAIEGGEVMSESTISAPGNTTSFDIAVSELAPGLQHQFQVSITLLRGGQKIEGERSIVTKQSTVVFDQAYFQLQIGPLEHPGTWSFTRGIKMEHVIRMEVATVIRRRCRCSFPLEYLRIGKLSCRSTFQQIVWVTYRSIVVALPSLSVTSLDLVQHIQAWVASNTTLCADPFILDVNPSCRVGVASLEEPECRSSSQGGN